MTAKAKDDDAAVLQSLQRSVHQSAAATAGKNGLMAEQNLDEDVSHDRTVDEEQEWLPEEKVKPERVSSAEPERRASRLHAMRCDLADLDLSRIV